MPGGPAKRKPLAPPKDLPEAAVDIWRDLAAELAPVTTSGDRFLLRRAVMKLLHLRRADEAIEARGGSLTYVTTTESGSTMERPYPEFGMVDSMERILFGLLGRFGLSPADRTRVIDSRGEPAGLIDDPIDEFVPRPRR